MVSSAQWKSNEIPLTRDLELKDMNSSYKTARERMTRKASGEIVGMWSERKDLSSRHISGHVTPPRSRKHKVRRLYALSQELKYKTLIRQKEPMWIQFISTDKHIEYATF